MPLGGSASVIEAGRQPRARLRELRSGPRRGRPAVPGLLPSVWNPEQQPPFGEGSIGWRETGSRTEWRGFQAGFGL